MELRLFASTGVDLPIVGQGTWNVPEHGAELSEAKRALQRGIELGMVHIDTAEMYGSGRAEEIVAEATAGVSRDGLFLTSKVLPSNAGYEGTLRACERTLNRLRTSYLDLYLLHWPSAHPIEETMRAFEKLVADGKTRFIGVSNFDVRELQAAQAALRTERLVCNQVLYHLRERGIEAELLPYSRAQNVAIVAYTPFGRGRFAGSERGGILAKVAAKHEKTMRQVILNWIVRDAAVFTIPKASKVRHVEENAGAAGWSLDAEDVAAIDRAFPMHYDGTLATL
ncbi:MAG: aldo/keto reductase [Candidatus Eremiobacteraeota bacterium]|nr:aldo/keto reductase [Candidatus Eremiobacteraeota bacterium]